MQAAVPHTQTFTLKEVKPKRASKDATNKGHWLHHCHLEQVCSICAAAASTATITLGCGSNLPLLLR